MTKKNTAKKVSAIDAIKQPFQFESKSTQTHSAPHDVRLGGVEKTVSVFDRRKGEYKSETRIEGGQIISASYRVRTGKTKRERAGKAKEAKVVETVAPKGKKKK
ncbi:hypothetical protein M5a_00117 [Klebsiella phage VLCpiM5a]|nr:hypothetical protein M5a_00117 [Klebsiella phage VLCpiM5a]